jgi:Flp pilus assembly protein TadD
VVRSRQHRIRELFKISSCLNLFLAYTFVLTPALSQESAAAQAQALLREGKPESALPILLELHRSTPENANLCQQIGVVYTQLNDLAHAEEFYREAVRINPQFHAARKNLGTVLWFLNRKEESEREFLLVAKSLPADPVPHLYLGLAAAGRHEFTHAKDEFKLAGNLALANPEVIQPVLESYLATQDLSFPSAVLRQLTQAENPDSETTSRAAVLFYQYGYYEQAAEALKKIISVHRESAETWRLLAATYDKQHKPDLAYSAYSRGIEMNPDSEDGYLALAEFASAHANNSYASQMVTRGLERVPQSPRLRFEQGILFSLMGDRIKADASFSEARRLKPEWDLPLLALGVSALESGNAIEAVTLFDKARTLDPHDARAFYLYALAISKESANTEAAGKNAIAALHKAIELDGNDAASHALLGHFELMAGSPATAAREWEAALKLDPKNATALYQLGLLYRREGKKEQAKRLLERFQQVKAQQRTEETRLEEILKVVPENAAP